MQHSVKQIADNYEKLSIMRKDRNQFNADNFVQYAKDNKVKYNLIEDSDDLFVSSWYSDSLINDYKLNKI